MVCKILRNSCFVVDIPIETIFETNAIDFYIKLKCTNATCRLLFWVAIAGNSLTYSISNLSLKMN